MRIIIIGAGIIGAALADRLGPHADVTVVEAGRPGEETTGHSFGWLNANRTVVASYLVFRMAAMRAWEELAAQFGEPVWYRRSGNTDWACGEATAGLAERVGRLQDAGYQARLITPAELKEIEPTLRPPPDALIAHFPGEGYVEGAPAVRALLARAGARMLTQTAVARLNLRDDRVTGVRLATGEDLDADVTICAAGWRAPELLATAHTSIPLLDSRAAGAEAPGLTALAAPAPQVLRGVIHTPDLDARPAAPDALLLEAEDLDTATDLTTPAEVLDAQAQELMARARRLIPVLTSASIVRANRCVRPLPADGFPLIGWQRPGLYTAVTHSGMTLGPHLARLIADEIVQGSPISDLSPYRPDRAIESAS